MLSYLIQISLLTAVIYVLELKLPGMKLKNKWAGFSVAIVFSVVNLLFGGLIAILTLPFYILSLGVLVNLILIYLTDLFLDSIEIQGVITYIVIAVVITISDSILGIIF